MYLGSVTIMWQSFSCPKPKITQLKATFRISSMDYDNLVVVASQRQATQTDTCRRKRHSMCVVCTEVCCGKWSNKDWKYHWSGNIDPERKRLFERETLTSPSFLQEQPPWNPLDSLWTIPKAKVLELVIHV
jgi:hypothetical protein